MTRPRIRLAWITIVVALVALTTVAPSQEVPPGHPPVPARMTPPAAEGASEAIPADVESVDAIIKAYYDTMSGPAGEARDWGRMRSLFIPDARLVTSRVTGAGTIPVVLKLDDFIQINGSYFEQGGYFETELSRKVDQFGSIAQAFSTYASRRALDDEAPYSRGINSFQVMQMDDRWWIVTIMWDFERPENPIPERYLTATPDPGEVNGE